MNIRPATLEDCARVQEIVHHTIQEVYPKYYPKGAVDFFLAHHKEESITKDILAEKVFLCEENGEIVGSVTLDEGVIHRLFVPPLYQGKGYGGALLDYAEKQAANACGSVELAASLPSKELYLKRGYRELSLHTIETENGDFLCYDLMGKRF